jgi:DNA gyrase/topoisomerase IV subunit B
VEQGKIYIMETPIITIGDRTKKYFYSVDEFLNFKGQKSSVRYLKGLGSLSIQDWDYVMADKLLIQIKKDAKGTKNLDMAFGKFSSLRKDWLSSK